MPTDDLSIAMLVGLLGLLIGSFLNVVIHRLPKIMEQQWEREINEYQSEKENLQINKEIKKSFNLLTPRSQCPTCGHVIKWYENIPVLSYLCLRGKCSSCQSNISPRYPSVELGTGLLFFYCGYRWGFTLTTLAWCGFSASLIALACIDWDTTLLPDNITQPLLWAGILSAAYQAIDTTLASSVLGAAAGYISLWLVYWSFKIATGKDGMGYGDFKLFAALGAWLGWQSLISVILMSSVIGAVVGIGMKLFNNLREGGYVPFGPFLVGAGLTSMIFGRDFISITVLRVLGI